MSVPHTNGTMLQEEKKQQPQSDSNSLPTVHIDKNLYQRSLSNPNKRKSHNTKNKRSSKNNNKLRMADLNPDKSISTQEDLETVSSWLKYKGGKLLCLYITLFVVDLSLLISCGLYLVRHDTSINDNTQVTYRTIGDIFSVIYRTIILCLCWRFINELLTGSFTLQELQAQQIDDENLRQLLLRRHINKYKWWEKLHYMFKNLDLNQFTIAALLCTVHQLFKAGLLWIAVYNGADKWYILSGVTYFLGGFSIAVPGICLNQFVRFHQKRKKKNLQSKDDIEATIISDLTKLEAIEQTIFSEGCIQWLILFGFMIELIQFCCVPAMNHKDVMIMQNVIYDCQGNINCDIRPDFVVCELVFRIFVGMSMLNNLVLLGSILSEQMHTETSLTNMAKIFNPICYVFLLLALLMDLRITDSYWQTEFKVVEWFWIVVHLISLWVIIHVFTKFFTLNHHIASKLKRGDIKAPTSLFCEAIILALFAVLSTFFISVDQELFQQFFHHRNIIIWRQWIMVVYHIAQIKILHFANKIQKVPSFPSKLGHPTDWTGCFGLKACCVWMAFINLYDFVYSFMFEAREYDQVMDGNEISEDEHNDILLYKWSYSLSFAVSHLMLWSLCCSIEFIVKYNEAFNQKKEENKRERNANDNHSLNGYRIPKRDISIKSDFGRAINKNYNDTNQEVLIQQHRYRLNSTDTMAGSQNTLSNIIVHQ